MKSVSSKPSVEHIFFFIIFAIVFYLFWTIIQPYVIVLITAIIAAILLSPIDRKLVQIFKHQKIVSALLTIGIFILIFVPTIVIILLFAKQASDFLIQMKTDGVFANFSVSSLPFYTFIPSSVQNQIAQFDLNIIGRTSAQWLFNNVGTIFQNTSRFALDTFVFFFALFYLLIDRKRLFAFLIHLSPLKKETDEFLLQRIVQTVRSVLFGILLLAIIQGIIAGIGMTIFNVPGAILWGSITILAALIPFFGTSLIMIPAIIYLFAAGQTFNGFGLMIWFFCLVGIIDNILAPFLIRGTTHMHAFLVLISILGGIEMFGPVGIVIGPAILAALMTLLELYRPGILIETKNKQIKNSR